MKVRQLRLLHQPLLQWVCPTWPVPQHLVLMATSGLICKTCHQAGSCKSYRKLVMLLCTVPKRLSEATLLPFSNLPYKGLVSRISFTQTLKYFKMEVTVHNRNVVCLNLARRDFIRKMFPGVIRFVLLQAKTSHDEACWFIMWPRTVEDGVRKIFSDRIFFIDFKCLSPGFVVDVLTRKTVALKYWFIHVGPVPKSIVNSK